jgi:hypothetical protein
MQRKKAGAEHQQMIENSTAVWKTQDAGAIVTSTRGMVRKPGSLKVF